MCATLNNNPYTTIFFCNIPIDASDKTDITTFYDLLSSLARYIPKHNVLIISGDMNTQIVKDENNNLGLHNLPNRNDEYLTDFSLENSLLYLNIRLKIGSKTTDLHLLKVH